MSSPAFVAASPGVLRLFTFTSRSLCSHHATPFTAVRRLRARVAQVRMSADAASTLAIQTESAGLENTLDYRLFFKNASGKDMSPWHDIPIYPDSSNNRIVNFVNEIPRGTQAKMEIATDELSTPIKQDVKKGALRFYKYGPSLINYGAIPQTWEDPGKTNEELQVAGDGDPVDVTEIGEKVMPFGEVYPVKILGCLALLDEGEIDWKIIAIKVDDPLADKMNDVADVERLMPGKIGAIREWFKMYKTAEGKGENEYAYNGEAKGAQFATDVVFETHESYSDLKNGKIKNEDELSLK